MPSVNTNVIQSRELTTPGVCTAFHTCTFQHGGNFTAVKLTVVYLRNLYHI